MKIKQCYKRIIIHDGLNQDIEFKENSYWFEIRLERTTL